MLGYIKLFIISLISAIFAPLASSSSAHFTFLNSVLDFSGDENQLGFYFSVISLVFSLTAIFFVRKIYAKGFLSLSKTGKKKLKNVKLYREMMLGILISLIPAVLMFIPVSKEKFLSEVFFDYFSGSNVLISAFCSVASGLILFVALWFSKKRKGKLKKSSRTSDVVRMSIYQIPAYIFPGFSHIASAATSLTVSMVDERAIIREILLYLAPSSLVISVFRIIRTLLIGVTFDPVMFVICTLGALIGNILIFNLVSQLNIRKTFLFFSVYSIIFGLAVGIFAFI